MSLIWDDTSTNIHGVMFTITSLVGVKKPNCGQPHHNDEDRTRKDFQVCTMKLKIQRLLHDF